MVTLTVIVTVISAHSTVTIVVGASPAGTSSFGTWPTRSYLAGAVVEGLVDTTEICKASEAVIILVAGAESFEDG